MSEAGPLEGVRVVSIAVNVPGPVAAARLRELGARVTTVLPPGGDPLAWAAPEWFAELHAGQDTPTLDLKSDGGRASLDDLLAEADVFITSHRPSALARLELDWASTSARFPRLSQIDVVGESGTAADRPGHDLTYQARNGLVRPPHLPVTLTADLAGAERAVSATLVALRVRDDGGAGVRQEVALADAAAAFAPPVASGLTAPGGVLGGGTPGYGIYPTSDGHIAFAALEPHFFDRACALAGLDPASADRNAWAAYFAQRSSAAWMAWASEHDVPLAVVD